MDLVELTDEDDSLQESWSDDDSDQMWSVDEDDYDREGSWLNE